MVRRKNSRSVFIVIVSSSVAAAVVLAAASPAQALPRVESTEPSPAAGISTEVVPETTTVVTDAGAVSAGITLPGAVSSSAAVDPGALPEGLFDGAGEAVLTTTLGDAAISSFATEKGTQTLIRVDSADAAHEYRFALSLPTGAGATVEPDGSVAVRSAAGDLLGGYESPWAYDALGSPVETRFTLDGNTLVQTVEFDQATAFPVIADPSDAWGWATCVSVVTLELIGNINFAGKVAKLVTRFGSIRKVMEVMYRAWRTSSNEEKRRKAVLDAVGGVAAEILGVAAIKAACID